MKHPFEIAAEGLEAEAAKPRNRAYRQAYLLSAASLRDQARADVGRLVPLHGSGGGSAPDGVAYPHIKKPVTP